MKDRPQPLCAKVGRSHYYIPHGGDKQLNPALPLTTIQACAYCGRVMPKPRQEISLTKQKCHVCHRADDHKMDCPERGRS